MKTFASAVFSPTIVTIEKKSSKLANGVEVIFENFVQDCQTNLDVKKFTSKTTSSVLSEYCLIETKEFIESDSFEIHDFSIPETKSFFFCRKTGEKIATSERIIETLKFLFSNPISVDLLIKDLCDILFKNDKGVLVEEATFELIQLIIRGTEDIPNPMVHLKKIFQYYENENDQNLKDTLQEMYIFDMRFLLYIWTLHRDKKEIFNRLFSVYRLDKTAFKFNAQLYFNGESTDINDVPVFDQIHQCLGKDDIIPTTEQLRKLWQITDNYLDVFS